MRIRAIAWDIDGTLADSEPLHHAALLGAGLRWAVDLSGLDEEVFRGVHMHDVWTAIEERFPPGLERSVWALAIEDHYVREAGVLRPMAGALDTIRAFRARGLPQACVSNSSRRIVDANLRALGITNDIVFSISVDDVAHGKPDPEPYRLACARFGLAPDTVLAVEDSLTGLRAARAAGLRTAAYGPHGGDADIVVPHLADLVSWIDAERRGTAAAEDAH